MPRVASRCGRMTTSSSSPDSTNWSRVVPRARAIGVNWSRAIRRWPVSIRLKVEGSAGSVRPGRQATSPGPYAVHGSADGPDVEFAVLRHTQDSMSLAHEMSKVGPCRATDTKAITGTGPATSILRQWPSCLISTRRSCTHTCRTWSLGSPTRRAIGHAAGSWTSVAAPVAAPWPWPCLRGGRRHGRRHVRSAAGSAQRQSPRSRSGQPDPYRGGRPGPGLAAIDPR